MGTLRIFLFGTIHLQLEKHAEDAMQIRLPRSTWELFSYLILGSHRTYSREVLAGKLWEGYSQTQARDCLNTTLWRLKRVIEPKNIKCGTYLLTKLNGEIGFNFDSDYWLDVEQFNSISNQILSKRLNTIQQEDADKLENALSLCVDDLLEGVYADWVIRKREQMQLLQLDSLAYLMEFYKKRYDYVKSICCGLKILEIDPLREEIHREMMRLHQLNDQRTLALRQYERCQTVLKDELGISPAEETTFLYQQILYEKIEHPKKLPEVRAQQKQSFEDSLKDLDHIMGSFITAYSQFKTTLQNMHDEINTNL